MSASTEHPESSWPIGGGTMGTLIRAHDWSATPLGARETWSQSLRAVVNLMLASPQPVCIAWGRDLTSLYNDSYILLLGSKHPGALGKPFGAACPEIREDVRPIIEATMAGQAQQVVDQPVALAGWPGGAVRWWTFSWTPLRDDMGTIMGLYCTAIETTTTSCADEFLRESGKAALHQSEERFQLVVANARDYAIFVTDEKGRITDWFPGAASVFGWSAEEAVGQTAAVLFTPEDRKAGVPDRELKVARRQGAAPDVRWHLRKDGSRGSSMAARLP